MQIAQIVPKSLTYKEDVFDYAIPPELLIHTKIGVLVEIPFHGRRIEGIILNLKRKTSADLKTTLKPILNIIDTTPVVDHIHIQLAQWMSKYYLVPLGKTLFENIVPPAKRILKKEGFTHIVTTKYTTFNAYAVKVGKKYLIIADFQKRLKFYLQAIQKTLAKSQSVIILVPDLKLIPYFSKYLKNSISILHAGLTKTHRWLEWDRIRKDQSKIIIGSNSALFAPAKNLGLIIIDQEENETYKNDRSPRFHAVKVAENLSKLTGANLVIGSITPRLETYFQTLKKVYILKKTTDKKKEHQITIVNMGSQRQTLSLPLQEKIEENINKKKKIILVLNRKGEGRRFSCPDCGWLFKCPRCDLPLVPQKDINVCYRCQKTLTTPEVCPQCQNVHLKPFGLGTTKLEKFVKDFWPKAKTIRVEEPFKLTSADIKKGNWDIAIVTSFALKFNFPPIGLTGIIDADQGLNFPDFYSAEKNFQTLYKFLKIAEEGIIQTNLPESSIIAALARLDYEKFFLNEMETRLKHQFPPFIKLIRLLYKNQDEDKCQKESQKIYDLLANFIKKNKLSNIAILGPAPALFRKKRNYFRWQLIIKISKAKNLEKFKEIFKGLPKGWLIDVDPVNLL